MMVGMIIKRFSKIYQNTCRRCVSGSACKGPRRPRGLFERQFRGICPRHRSGPYLGAQTPLSLRLTLSLSQTLRLCTRKAWAPPSAFEIEQPRNAGHTPPTFRHHANCQTSLVLTHPAVNRPGRVIHGAEGVAIDLNRAILRSRNRPLRH